MTNDLIPTPFAESYPDGVAEWIDVMGFAVPLTWGDPAREYEAVRNHAAAMEFSMLLKWDVRGPSAKAFVNRIFSRDMARLQPGQIAYGVIVSEAGKMLDDCTVFVHGPEHVRIFGGNPEVGTCLENKRPAQVSIEQKREAFAQLSVQGPKSRKILQEMTRQNLSNESLPYYRFLENVEMAGMSVQLSRIGFTGELGFEVMLPTEQAGRFWEALFEAGKTDGLVAAGAAAVMMCRIESGMIMAELEYDHTMTPYECRMGWAVDLHKGDFQGKPALELAKDSPQVGICSVVLPGEGEFDGKLLLRDNTPVGHVTMAIPSPCLGGRFLGLSRVDRDCLSPGTLLELEGVDQPATVVSTPVYDPERIRVRS